MRPGELPEVWRDEAKRIRDRHGAVESARTLEAVAADLERALNDHQSEPITRNQLAAEIGCYPDSISRAAKKGKIRNIGTKGAPRFRRADITKLQMHLRGRNGVADEAAGVASITPAFRRDLKRVDNE